MERQKERAGLTLISLFLLGNGLFAVLGAYAFNPDRTGPASRGVAFETPASKPHATLPSEKPDNRMLLSGGLPGPASGPVPAAASPAAPARGAKWALSPMESSYERLMLQSRNWNSPVLRAWTREFLSYPDLNAINARYHQDHDPIRFLVDAASSPNFQAMAVRYLTSPDVRRFLGELASDPQITAASPALMKDARLRAASQTLEAAGIYLERNGVNAAGGKP